MEDWIKELPEELQADPTLTRYKSLEDLARGHVETKGLLGRSITLPGSEAGEDERRKFLESIQEKAPELTLKPTEENADDFWRMAGRPDKPEDYAMPDDVKMDEDAEKRFRAFAAEAGMTQEQFAKAARNTASGLKEMQEAAQAAQEADNRIIDDSWGMAKTQNTQVVEALVAQFQDPNHPVKDLNAAGKLLLARIAKAFKQDPQVFKQPAGDGKLTPAEAEKERESIRTRLIEEGRNMHPAERQRLNDKLIRLYQQ